MITILLLMLVATLSAAWSVQAAVEEVLPDLMWLAQVRHDEQAHAEAERVLDAQIVRDNRVLLGEQSLAGYGLTSAWDLAR